MSNVVDIWVEGTIEYTILGPPQPWGIFFLNLTIKAPKIQEQKDIKKVHIIKQILMKQI